LTLSSSTGKNPHRFGGRVGTGFSEQLLRSLFSNLEKIRTEQSPYSKVPAKGRNRRGEGLTAAEMRRCHWVKPVMVCQVKFTEWTRDDRLRQPVFLGIKKAVHETQAFDTGTFSPSTIRPACRLNGCPEPEEMA
jgi:ATP-dependent DNA ligase